MSKPLVEVVEGDQSQKQGAGNKINLSLLFRSSTNFFADLSHSLHLNTKVSQLGYEARLGLALAM